MTQVLQQSSQIQSSTIYGEFQLMTGNRYIDTAHVKRLKKEMEENPNLLLASPILVNEHKFIIDGQHRYHAAKELGKPIYYIMQPGLTVDAARHLNITQKRWTLLDFAQSYADSGRAAYQTFLSLHRKFPSIPPSVLRLYLVGGLTHDTDRDFRNGKFEISDVKKSVEFLERLSIVIDKVGHINTPMASALLLIMRDRADDFDFDRLSRKLDNESAREMFVITNNTRTCYRSVEDVYNFQSRIRTRLY